MKSSSYARPMVWLMVVTLTIAVALSPVFSPLQPIPANDADLDRILAKIKPYENLASRCAAADCPEMDCATAQQMQTRLRDARIVMRYAAYWLRRATDDQLRHLTNIAGESTEANARAAKVQEIMAWQQLVVGVSSGMLEIASMSTNINEILDNPNLLKSKSYGEMADLLDKFYECMKDGEALAKRLSDAQHDSDLPQPIADMMPSLNSLSSSEMNDLKSTLSDIKSLMEEAAKHGKDWRSTLRQGRGTIGQIAGRYLKAYAESQIAQRKRLVDSLLNDVLAQDAVQSQAFKDLGRMQVRRNKAEDAYLALDKLLVIAPGRGQMAQCLLKMRKSCTALDLNYASQYRLPADIEVADFRIIGEEDRRKSWGNALLKINALLPTVEGWLGDVPQLRLTVPSLQLNKFAFRAGEQIAVEVSIPPCCKSSSWAGVTSTNVAHGDEAQNAQNVLSEKRELSAIPEGYLLFHAPRQAGRYDVRMSDRESGKELASVSFQVECNQTTASKKISATEALLRIGRLKKTIQDRRHQMSYLYGGDGHACDTLRAEFLRIKVYRGALKYADDWGLNGVYLTWHYNIVPFYGIHMAALDNSISLIKQNKSTEVRESDIVYLENGVTNWQEKEKQLSIEMFNHIYHMAKYAYCLGEGMRNDARRAEYRRLAELPAKMRDEAKRRASNIAAQRIFSSLRDSNRIPLEASTLCR